MDSAIVDKVRELVKAATEPPTLQVPGEDPRYYLLRDPKTGEYKPETKRVHERLSIHSLASLADFAKTYSTGEFWFTRGQVCYIHDPDVLANRIGFPDRATLPLKPSPAMVILSRWSEGIHHAKQAETARLLRTTFRDSVEPGNLVESVSSITWKTDEQGKSVIATGSRSVGKSVESRVQGLHQLPDVVMFNVPVWETGGPQLSRFEVTIGCVLEVDAPNQTFAFIPFAGAIEMAWALAEAELERLLRQQIERVFADTVEGEEPVEWPPVYHGVPSA